MKFDISKTGIIPCAEVSWTFFDRVQCEECDLWVPREDICYLAGIQKDLCSECASDHQSEDWK